MSMRKTAMFALAIALSSALFGCRTEQKGSEPIVSPTVISDDKADEEEPQLPFFVPWFMEFEERN